MLSPTYQLLPPLTRDHFVWRETIFYFHNIIYLILDFGQKRFPQSENQTKAKFFCSKKTWQIGIKKTMLGRRNSSERGVLRCSWGHAWRNLKYGSYKDCERYGQKKGNKQRGFFPIISKTSWVGRLFAWMPKKLAEKDSGKTILATSR